MMRISIDIYAHTRPTLLLISCKLYIYTHHKHQVMALTSDTLCIGASLWCQIIRDDFQTGTNLDINFEPCIYDHMRRPYTYTLIYIYNLCYIYIISLSNNAYLGQPMLTFWRDYIHKMHGAAWIISYASNNT